MTAPSDGVVLREYLGTVTGFAVPEDRWKLLAPGLLARVALRGFKDESAYVDYLKNDIFGHTELEEVLSILTVRKTSFFRNPAAFEALARDVLPAPVEAASRGGPPVSLWSAGCSTGEEPYSLAIVARSLAQASPRPCYVLATDIVTGALTRARRGVYARDAIQEIPERYRSFLSVEEGRIEIAEGVRSSIEFHAHNLVRDAFPRPASGLWDVIFCRNVLIYFGADVARRVIEKFHESLSEGGALFLGHAEVLWGLESLFDVVFSGETFFYRKRTRSLGDTRRAIPRPVLTGRSSQATPPTSMLRPMTPVGGSRIDPRSDGSSLLPPARDGTPARAFVRPSPMATPVRGQERPGGPPTPARGADRPPFGTPPPPIRPDDPIERTPQKPFVPWPSSPDQAPVKGERALIKASVPHESTPTRPLPVLPFALLARAETALAAGDTEGAARSLRQAVVSAPSWAPPRLLLGRVYADQGETDRALQELEIAARAEPLEPRVHMLIGTVREKRMEREAAEEAYRRAVYLEPDYVAARYALAQIYRATGRTDRARRELRNAIRTLTTKPGEVAARFTDGVSPQALAESCERELRTLD